MISRTINDSLVGIIFLPFSRAYTRAFEYNKFRQDGLCRLCKNTIHYGEAIISKGDRKTKYYHEACAKKMMII